MTSRSSLVAATAALIVLLPLSACSSGTAAPPADDGGDAAPSASAPAAAAPDEPAETYGCTPELLAYAQQYGYPAAKPLDPASLEIPDVTFAQGPTCYLTDEDTGAVRYAAFWAEDPQGVLTALGAALDEAGYQQSDDYGPLIWWKGGDEPTSAEHAVGAAPQPVDGVDVLYVTW